MAVATSVARRYRAASLVVLLGLQSGIALIFAVLSARWLGPDDRGVVVVIVTASSLLMLLGSLGTATGGRVLLAQDNPSLTLVRHARLSSFVSGWQAPVIVLFGWPLLFVTSAWRGWLPAILFVAYGVGLTGAYMTREALHGVGMHRRAVGGDVLTGTMQILLIVVLYLAGWLSLSGVLTIMVISIWVQTVILRLLVLSISRYTRTTTPSMKLRELVAFSIPALISTLGQAFAVRGDKLILGVYAGTTPVGLYAVAASFCSAIWLPALGLSQICLRASAQGRHQQVRQIRIANAVVTVAAAAIAFVIAESVVQLLLGSSYAAAVPMARILLIASILMSLYLVEAAALNGAGLMKVPGRAAVCGSIVLLTGCVILIPPLGAHGAAFASCAAYAAMLAVAAHGARRAHSREDRPIAAPDTSV
jgi:O-antigen/teichoic acid export membrane protein